MDSLTKAFAFALAFAAPHAAKGTVFLLTGRDTDALVEAVKRLAKLPSMPAQGLIFQTKFFGDYVLGSQA